MYVFVYVCAVALVVFLVCVGRVRCWRARLFDGYLNAVWQVCVWTWGGGFVWARQNERNQRASVHVCAPGHALVEPKFTPSPPVPLPLDSAQTLHAENMRDAAGANQSLLQLWRFVLQVCV